MTIRPSAGEPPRLGHPRILAIDWSGARAGGGRRKIWLAEVRDGALRRLESGRTRPEVIDHLIEEAGRGDEMIVGLDFAFSFPSWYLEREGARRGRAVWRRVAERGEGWLERCEAPFWGRPGHPRPELPAHFRQTELAAQQVTGSRPKSVFQIGGGGAVGTGSLRGMPHLARLANGGFSIWPFDDPGPRMVLEIYPRLLTGPVVKSHPRARATYLSGAHPEIRGELRDLAVGSEDALDAAVSAVIMARHMGEIRALEPVTDPTIRKEGWIWWPGTGGQEEEGDAEAGTTGTQDGEVRPCPFCSVEPGLIREASASCVALLDAYPVTERHTLVVPRRHVASVFDLAEDERQNLWRLVARVRDALMELDGVEGCTVGINDGPVAGQTVDHAHVHVIPRRRGEVPDPRGGVRWVIPQRAVYWDE